MAYQPTVWKNREVERPRTFTVQNNPDGTVTLIPAEGVVNEPGTPIMAVNLNKIEDELVRQEGVTTKHLENDDRHLKAGERGTWNSGFLAKSNKFLSGPTLDFNTVETNTAYQIGDLAGSKNAPPIAWGILLDYKPEHTYRIQEFITAIGNVKYSRLFDNGVANDKWSPWRQDTFHQGTIDSWNHGYSAYLRFPEYCKTIDDWDLALQNGMYMGSGVLNAPDSDWCMGVVVAHNPEWVVQKVIQFTGTRGQREYERWKQNGTWGSWVETSPMLLFKSVSSGKAKIAGATTDMGVYTAPDATFDTMSDNIRMLSTGASGNGNATNNGSQTVFSVSGLKFRPRVISITFISNGNRIVYNGSVSQNVDAFVHVSGTWHNYGASIQITDNGFTITVVTPLSGQYRWEAFK
ncbi:MAG: pyocin knob domain-containing protein [Lysinibacillus sp.]